LFGVRVAIKGDTVVIGSPGDGDKSGSVYIFTRSGTIFWTQQLKLTASDAPEFGVSIALSDDTVVVGSAEDKDFSGSAYIFDLTQ